MEENEETIQEYEEPERSKSEIERDLIKTIKERLDLMKFSSSPAQFAEILILLEQFMASRGILPSQVEWKKKRMR